MTVGISVPGSLTRVFTVKTLDPSPRDVPSARQPGFSTGIEPSQRSQAATSTCGSRVPSTVISNKLATLDTIVTQLADKVDRLTLQNRESMEVKTQIDYLTEENEMLRDMLDISTSSLSWRTGDMSRVLHELS